MECMERKYIKSAEVYVKVMFKNTSCLEDRPEGEYGKEEWALHK